MGKQTPAIAAVDALLSFSGGLPSKPTQRSRFITPEQAKEFLILDGTLRGLIPAGIAPLPCMLPCDRSSELRGYTQLKITWTLSGGIASYEDYNERLLALRAALHTAEPGAANTFKVFFRGTVQPDVREMAELLAADPDIGINEAAQKTTEKKGRSWRGLYQRFHKKREAGDIRFEPDTRC